MSHAEICIGTTANDCLRAALFALVLANQGAITPEVAVGGGTSAFNDPLPAQPRPCSGQAHKWIMYCHVQWLKMPEVPGQDGQPVVLGGGGDDDVGEAGCVALASGAV